MFRSYSLGSGLRSFGIIGSLAILSLPSPAHAQWIWNGNGGTGIWSTPANWNVMAAPPSNPDVVISFAGAVGLTPNQNIASPFILNSLTFIPPIGAFDLSGGSLDFRSSTGGSLPTMVQNALTAVIVRNNLVLSNDLTYNGVGTADLKGVISGLGGLTKAGAGTLTLSANNIYAGATNVNGGTLRMGIHDVALPNNTALTVAVGAFLEMNGFETTIGSLAGGGTAQNLTGAFRTLRVGRNHTSTTFSGVIAGVTHLAKEGDGVMTLTNTNNAYTGSTLVQDGTLRMGTVTALPAATDVFVYGGATLDLNGFDTTVGSLHSAGFAGGEVTTAGAVLTVGNSISSNYSGAITGTGGLTKVGTGVLTLSGTNTYTGETFVNFGVLRLTGQSVSNSVTVGSGTFRIEGGTLTLPSFGNVTVAGGTAEYSNATVNGGFLRGPGTHTLLTGATLNGGTALNGAVINQTGAATLINFTNSGQITNSATLMWDGGYNTSAGRLTVNSTTNVRFFESNGQINVPTGGTLNNVSTSSGIVLGGGSTTFVGTPAVMGGLINVGTQPLLVRGGLLVNNGAIGNSTGNGQVIVDYGGFAKGAGFWDSLPITINGGRFSPGNSPGRVTVGSVNMTPGGIYDFEINNATGTAGPIGTMNLSGWDLTIVSNQINPTLSNLTVSATSATPFTINLVTLTNPSPPDVPGQMANFNPAAPFSWLAFDVNTAGSVVNWDPSAIVVNTSQFMNTFNGTFALVRDTGNPFQFLITYTPVPEPMWILSVAAFAGWGARRFVRSRQLRRPASPQA